MTTKNSFYDNNNDNKNSDEYAIFILLSIKNPFILTKEKRRVSSRIKKLPSGVTFILKNWIFKHLNNPYPTETQKRILANSTGLTIVQVSNWFINARRRLLKKNKHKWEKR